MDINDQAQMNTYYMDSMTCEASFPQVLCSSQLSLLLNLMLITSGIPQHLIRL